MYVACVMMALMAMVPKWWPLSVYLFIIRHCMFANYVSVRTFVLFWWLWLWLWWCRRVYSVRVHCCVIMCAMTVVLVLLYLC